MNYDPEYIEDLKNEDLTHEVTDIDHATLDSLEVLTGIPKAYFKREVVIFKPLINPMQQGRAVCEFIHTHQFDLQIIIFFY